MENNNKIFRVSTPGRICLFGEHQDYLQLPVVACAISRRITIEGHKTNDQSVTLELPNIRSHETFSLNDTLRYTKDRDYYKSAINVLKRHGFTFSSGISGTVRGDIPINSGTSSSSALIVTWIHFLARISDQAKMLKPEQIALYAHEAEVLEFGEPGGMMDHYSTAIGGIILIEFYPEVLINKVDFLPSTIVLGDSCEAKNTKSILSGVKEPIIDGIKRIHKINPSFSLQTATKNDIESYSNSLNDNQVKLLKGAIKNRNITREAQSLFNRHGMNHEKIGDLLNEHQSVLRDTLKISTPKIDRMIDSSLQSGALGAKINGSGGGGCMFAYAPVNPEKVKAAIEKAGGKAYIIHMDKGTHFENKEDYV